MLIMSCYSTLGSLTCEEDGNLSTRDLGIIYVSSEGRVGCEFIHPAQPTDAPSSRRSSRSHFYTPGFPRGCIESEYQNSFIKSIKKPVRAQNYRHLHFTLTMILMISNIYDIYKNNKNKYR